MTSSATLPHLPSFDHWTFASTIIHSCVVFSFSLYAQLRQIVAEVSQDHDSHFISWEDFKIALSPSMA